jgi:hypothetical protein
MVLGKQWMTVYRSDGTIELRTRIPLPPMHIPQRWEVEDDSSSGVDKDMLQSWNDNSGGGDGLSKGTSEIREMESEHAINIRDLEDKVLEEEFGSIVNEHANTVRRSGRVRTQVDIYSPEDPLSDQRDYDWESH